MQNENSSIIAQYKRLLSGTWKYAGDDRKRIVQFFSMFIVANVIFMTQPYVLGELINTLQEGGDNLKQETMKWLLYYVAGTVFFWVFHGPARVIERDVAYTVQKSFNMHFYRQLTRLPLHWHHDHHSGSTINRINKASGAITGFSESQFVYLQSIVRFVCVFVALALVDIYVSLALFVISCSIFYMLTKFDVVIMRLNHIINEKSHKFSAFLYDFVGNIQNVIMFNLAKFTKGQLSDAMQDWYPPYRKTLTLVEWKWGLMSLLIVLSHFVVLYFYIAHHLSTGNALMLGTLVAIFQYMLRLDSVFVVVAQNYAHLICIHTDFCAVDKIQETYDTIGIKDDHLPDLKIDGGAISYKNVNFSYNASAAVFKDFNLNIKPHEKVGIIGKSGAGKSTLVSLLLRFYESDDCRIEIDGQDISKINMHSLREHVAVIPQDTTLFEDTLMENIRFGKLGATDEEVISASKQAHCHEFIEQSPKGYQSEVGERGLKLSGGQRQRIAIARAILKGTPILVLDEATSALDTESEHMIQDSLKELMVGRTVIAIAHRLSTIAHMDRLIVLDGGEIIEDGSHEDLLKKNGVYAQLWNKQSSGFLLEDDNDTDKKKRKKSA